MTSFAPAQRTLGELSRDAEIVGHAELVPRDEARAAARFAIPLRAEAIWARMGGAVPHRRDIDPVAIGAELLPHMVIFDVIGGGEDYRFRLFGGAHAAQYGTDLTGLTVAEINRANPTAANLKEILDEAVDGSGPTYWSLRYMSASALVRSASGVFLPLTEGSGSIDALLGCAAWS